jgi:hypothetical protein
MPRFIGSAATAVWSGVYNQHINRINAGAVRITAMRDHPDEVTEQGS